MLKEKLNKKEVLIKFLVGTIKNLTKNSLNQQPIQSQSFTSEFKKKTHHISTVSPVNYKNFNLDNTNMNTSTMDDDLHNKSMDIVLKKCNDNSNWNN